MDQEGMMYLVFCLLLPLVAFSQLPAFGGGISIIIAVLILIVIIALLATIAMADHLIFSALCNVFGITFQPASGYKIVRSQDAIVKEVNGLFYATGFVTSNLFAYSFREESTEEDYEDKLMAAPESWERAVMNIKFPFKYHVISIGRDVQKVRDDLEGQRSYQEFQLSRTMQSGSANEVAITDLQRKINVLQTKMDRISRGERPIATLMYLETTAIGVTEKAALDSLSSQINELQIALSAMDTAQTRIMGRELYTLFKFDFGLPTSLEEMAYNFDQQS